MMNNLFLSFDPFSVSLYSNFFLYFVLFTGFFLMFYQNMSKNSYTNWLSDSSYFKGFNWVMGPYSIPYNSIKPFKVGSISQSVCMGIFSYILFYNIISLFPYNFSFTSMTFMMLILSICFWGISLIYFFKNSHWAHLIPSGSPMALSPFLFIIEIISLVIRPLTLALRLSANITSGHILVHLASSSLLTNKIFMVSPVLMLNILELMVSFIQAYVFMSLISLYSSEMQ
uniref:ATP synthase F0 subunit 6 n=1 Tax=Parachordodes pustulosus TaxID=3049253 RepID=UPI002E77F483|nr:ATP synthase F0 subunit 6 [Parachordodes pustulosus]WQH58892.1 ATP synthase F0 subunit 6 [Parachordodes pustulosus]